MSLRMRAKSIVSRLLVASFVSLPLLPAAGADESADLAQLEAILAAQQRRIETLREQVAASGAQDDRMHRADMLREQVRTTLSDAEFREGLMPAIVQAGYDKGFFIRSTDDKFRLEFHGRMQFRYSYYNTRERNHYLLPRLNRNDRSGFDVKRIRFHVLGNIFNPDLTYFVKWMADSPVGYDPRILYAYLNYRFVDEFQVRMGIFQLAGTRASFQSSANMQFVEYPVVDAVFSTNEGLGVRFWGQLFDQKFEYFFDVVNSLNAFTNRTITPDPAELDGNPAIALRGVWHIAGKAADFISWSDIEHHADPALDLGFHYAFNENDGDLRTSRIVFNRQTLQPGGFGVTTAHGLQTNQFGLDAAFKWRGFSLSGEYILRILDPRNTEKAPFAPLFLLTNETSTVAQHGGYVQAGYFLPIPGHEKKVEAVARIGGIAANTEGSEGTWTYAGGLNYYFEGNRAKLQADITKVSEVPITANSWLGNVNDDALIFRVQLQVAF